MMAYRHGELAGKDGEDKDDGENRHADDELAVETRRTETAHADQRECSGSDKADDGDGEHGEDVPHIAVVAMTQQ